MFGMKPNAMRKIIKKIVEKEDMQQKRIAAIIDVPQSTLSSWKESKDSKDSKDSYKSVYIHESHIKLYYWYLKIEEKEAITDEETFTKKMDEHQEIDVSKFFENKENKSLEEIAKEFEEAYKNLRNQDNSQKEEQAQDLIQEEDMEQSEDNIQEEKEEGKSADDSLNEVGEECFRQEEISEERGDNDQKAREQQFADDNHEEGIGSKNVNIKYDVTKKDLRFLAEERDQEVEYLLDERTKLTVSKNKKILMKNEKKLQKTIDEEIDILEKLTEYGDSEAMYGLAMIYNSNVYQNANKKDYFKWLLKCAETFDFRSSVKNAKNRKIDYALGALKKCGDYLNNLPEPSVEGEILTAAYDYIDYYIANKTNYYPRIPIDSPEGEGFSIQPYLGKSVNKVDIKKNIVNKYKEQYDKLWMLFEKILIHENIRSKRLLNIISEEIKKMK